ncbi:MAG: SLC13/DASS family transporter [Nitrospirae bacterium]|nr:SLC13/DASS family transporter [Nitrospirota bacterium]
MTDPTDEGGPAQPDGAKGLEESKPSREPPGDEEFVPVQTVIVGTGGTPPSAVGYRQRLSPTQVRAKLARRLGEQGAVRTISYIVRRLRKPLILAAGALLFYLLSTAPWLGALDPVGRKTLGVFGVAVLLWMTGALPMMVTGLAVLLLIPLLGILTPRETFSLVTNDAAVFVLGVFILSGALIETGVTKRIALLLMEKFGHSPQALLVTVFLTNVLLSFFISEHAVAAMMFPILLDLARAIQLVSRSQTYVKGLILCAAWGTTAGGILTLLGGGRAPLAVGMMKEVTGVGFGFFEWIKFSAPVTLPIIAGAYVALRLSMKVDLASMAGARQYLRQQIKDIGPPRVREVVCVGILGLCILLWATLGEQYGMAVIALLGAVLVFVFGIASWREVEANVNWGIYLMYGGAICLAQALSRTGVSSWVSETLITNLVDSPAKAVFLVSALALILTEFMSNAAVVAVLLPVALPLSQLYGIDPRVLAVAVAIPAGINFIFPIATPANAIAFSSGFLRMRDVLLPGLILDAFALVVIAVVGLLIWPQLV